VAERAEDAGVVQPDGCDRHLMHAELTDWIPRVRMILEDQDTRSFEPLTARFRA